ncbi:hypothetical protein GR11A_00085 [Vibrio phage vB_VcorM_GR11A]|nr:hypothetical protein GR11A_00085 [Vibrio phage vB_VcorM_GR11A]
MSILKYAYRIKFFLIFVIMYVAYTLWSLDFARSCHKGLWEVCETLGGQLEVLNLIHTISIYPALAVALIALLVDLHYYRRELDDAGLELKL